MVVLVIIGIVVKEKDNVLSYFEQAGILALCLNVSTMFIGMLTARIARLDLRQSLSISIESGIQNGTLAIAVATITLGDSKYAIAGAIYSLIMFATGFIAIYFGNKLLTKN